MNFFTSIGNTLADQLPKANHDYNKYLNPPLMKSFFCADITYDEIKSEILMLHHQEKASHESINVDILADVAYIIAHPLQMIFTQSLLSGIVPDSFKIAKVIPIYKKGSHTDPGNYRPISLLPVFDKIIEKIICHRLMKFWDYHKVINNFQFGFREKHSTMLALTEITDCIYKWLANKDYALYVMGIYLDLQKAFDTVDHDILKIKLYNYDIRVLVIGLVVIFLIVSNL